jgi:hypothetical protein
VYDDGVAFWVTVGVGRERIVIGQNSHFSWVSFNNWLNALVSVESVKGRDRKTVDDDGEQDEPVDDGTHGFESNDLPRRSCDTFSGSLDWSSQLERSRIHSAYAFRQIHLWSMEPDLSGNSARPKECGKEQTGRSHCREHPLIGKNHVFTVLSIP